MIDIRNYFNCFSNRLIKSKHVTKHLVTFLSIFYKLCYGNVFFKHIVLKDFTDLE